MKIAFIGHGHVGGALASRTHALGHDVTIAAADPRSASLQGLQARLPALSIAPPDAAVRASEVVVLATPFQAHVEILTPLVTTLAGKILVDCTNPVGPGLSHGLASARSGTEVIQALLPETRVVKAFSIYGFENFEDALTPDHGVKPAMLFCGNDPAAKATVATLLDELGWEPVDVGGVQQALHLEHMTLLWVRMVRMGGRSPRTVWAMLTR